jgi:WhiB family redox-sensing transcriptional regulator
LPWLNQCAPDFSMLAATRWNSITSSEKVHLPHHRVRAAESFPGTVRRKPARCGQLAASAQEGMANAMMIATSKWWEQAACQAADPELFFPVAAGRSGTAMAKAICASCAIRRRCLDYALDTRQEHGVWGGASEDERRAIVASRSRTRLSRAG